MLFRSQAPTDICDEHDETTVIPLDPLEDWFNQWFNNNDNNGNNNSNGNGNLDNNHIDNGDNEEIVPLEPQFNY